MQKIRRFLLILGCFTSCFAVLYAQTSKDATVPLTATLNANSITLNWTNPTSSKLVLLRRTKGQSGAQWIQLLNVNASTQTSLEDTQNIVQGATYEYVLQRVIGTVNAFGYAHVAMNAGVTDSRGKIILYLDEDLVNPLAAEIARLKADLIGDGWLVIEHLSKSTSSVSEIRNQLIADWNSDPAEVKAVFLLGKIPVPYSGNTAWDGHPEHNGAWPADAYYADLNGNWTDQTTNNTTTGRLANRNVPGDGKFDQSIIPTAAELQVGRVDFRRLNPVDFGAANEAALYKRYLDKDHAWRSGAYSVENKALVDDNFGFFSGEAFAANGFRNAYPLVGESNVEQTDFFNNSNPQRWLLGYGTGGGTYTSASGVGSSTNFMSDTVHIVFSNLFGSYHGDWDYESNPFMPSALASRGGILNCAWAGRPHWFNQALASGETIGYCAKETLNANMNNGFFGSFGESGAHVSLLGDPSIRAHVVKAPDLTQGSFLIEKQCNKLKLSWPASPDASVAGYHVYRAAQEEGPFVRISTSVVADLTFTDNSPVEGANYYQIRAIKAVSTPGGGVYLNNSTAVSESYVYIVPSNLPQVTASALPLNCISTQTQLVPTVNTNIVAWSWSGPSGFMNPAPSPQVSQTGLYTLTVTDAQGCTATTTVTVVRDDLKPTAEVSPQHSTLTCLTPTTTLMLTNANMNLLPASCVWLGPGLPGLSSGLSVTVSQPGLYYVTITGVNGCTNTLETMVNQDVAFPSFTLMPNVLSLTCSQTSVTLPNPGIDGSTMTWQWSGPCLSGPMFSVATCPGVYTLYVANTQNGCTSSATVLVLSNVTPPFTAIELDEGSTMDCNPEVVLKALTDAPNALFTWNGPGINIENKYLQNPVVDQSGLYTLVVEEASDGCTGSATYNLSIIDPLPVFTLNCNQLSCSNNSASLSVSGFSSDASIMWYGNNVSSNTPQITVNTPGYYVVQVISPQGCEHRDTCFVFQPNTLLAGITAQVDCSFDVTFFSTVSGGQAPYAYLWSTGETNPQITVPFANLPVTLTVTDANNCSQTLTSPAVVITQPPTVIVEAVTPASSPTAQDGAIGLSSSSNAVGYLWSNGNTTEDISGLVQGTYTCTITDLVSGCTVVVSATVSALSAVHSPGTSTFQQFILSPNPASSLTMLQVQLREPGALNFNLIAADGRVLYRKNMDKALFFSEQIPLDLLPSGAYQLLLVTERETKSRTLFVQH